MAITGEIVKEYLEKFPNTSSLCLARIIYLNNKEVFNTVEHARMIIRYHRGASGKKNRKRLTNKNYVRKFIQYTGEP